MAGSNTKNSRPAARSAAAKAAPAAKAVEAKPAVHNKVEAKAAPSKVAEKAAPPKAEAKKSRATVTFEAGWKHSSQGQLTAGGQIVISYDPNRAQLRAGNGSPTWGVQAFVKMLPSGQVVEQPVIESGKSRPATVEVPRGTTELQIWFKNWTDSGEQWDSNLGKNYCFQVG